MICINKKKSTIVKAIMKIFVSILLASYFVISVFISWQGIEAREFHLTSIRSHIFLTIPISLSILFFLAFFLSYQWRLAIVVNIGVTYIALFVGNLYIGNQEYSNFKNLKQISSHSPSTFLRTKEGSNFVAYTTGENIKRLYSADLYKLGGEAYAKTVLCNESGELITYQADRYGFNNDDGGWDDSYSRKLLLLGDSFVHGVCPSENNSIAAQIDLLQPNLYRVINLSFSGNGPLSNLGIFLEYADKLKNIDTVIYFHYEGNDIYPNLSSEVTRKELRGYLQDKIQNLSSRQDEIDNFSRLYTKDVRAHLNDELIKQIFKKLKLLHLKLLFSSIVEKKTADYDLFKQVIEKLISLTYSQNIDLVFVYIPTSETFLNNKTHLEQRKKVLSLTKTLKIGTIDMYNIFVGERKPLNNYYFVGSHLSDQGSKRVAAEVNNFLTKMRKKKI